MAKKEHVREMFDGIASKYDQLNHLLSLGIDRGWRRKSLRQLEPALGKVLLDVACGTGDFSIGALRQGVRRVVGVDISENMLAVARKKAMALGLENELDFQPGDGENLCFPDDSFDAVTVAFGARNFEHLEKGLSEMCRVVKPGGKVLVLEFSMPRRFPMRQLYRFYFKHILPRVGGHISGDRQAYEYLPESVFAFPQGEAFIQIMHSCGFRNVLQKRFTFGIATLYVGEK